MSTERRPISRDKAQPPFFVGVDLGGQGIKIGIVDDRGHWLAFERIGTEVSRGPEEGTRRMAEAIHQLAKKAQVATSEIGSVGLGSPGTMDVPAGMLLAPHNLPGWFDFPIRDRLSHHAGLPVTFSNDANAAAYGEFWIGSGRNFHSMVLFTLGTGIGCGIIIGDMLIEGENSHGAECGHIIIDSAENARVCPCGQPGHLEAYASANAVVARTEEALEAGRSSSLSDRIAGGEKLSPLMLSEEANRGDELALEIVLETARYLGIGTVTLLHTIDPNGVVLAGAMTFGGPNDPLGRRFLARIKEEVQRRAFPVVAERIQIEFASLGGDAGYIGAAGIARLAYRKQHSE